MSFNDQVQNLSVGGGRRGVFKEGIKSKSFSGDSAILFRIQPAYNYEDKDAAGNINPCGWLPCRNVDGTLTAWGGIIRVCRFVGHGHGKASNRRDFLSPWTFGKPDTTFCPLNTLYVAASNYPEWQYLLEDKRDASNRVIERSSLSQPSEQLVINAVELSGGAMPENILGLLSKSACDALVSPHKNGLLFQRANNVTDEDIARNPLSAWAIGDITHPANGPVMYVAKAPDGKGKMASYMVGLATDPSQRVRRYPLSAELMQCRYDLSDMHNVVEPRTDEEIVKDLVQIFCMRSPAGYHEYALLKLAFGDFFKIPEPPAAPAASATVAAGGYAQPGLPPAGGFGNNPAGNIPDYGAQPGQPAVGGFPGQPAQGGFPGQPVAGGFPAPGGMQPGAQPVAGPVGPVGPRPGGPVGPRPAGAAPQNGPVSHNGPVGPQPGAVAPGMGGVSAAAGAGAAPQGAQPSTVVAPGDAVRPFDRQGFLGDMRKPAGT